MTNEERHAGFARLAADSYVLNRDGWGVAPWRTVVNGEDWIVATDGHAFVATAPELIAGDCGKAPEKVEALAQKWVPVKREAVALDVARLRAFFDAMPELCEECQNTRKVDCAECEGEGSLECRCDDCGDEHERDCRACRGTGEKRCGRCTATTNDRAVSLLGLTVDRFKLAALLRLLPDGAEVVLVSLVSHGSTEYGDNAYLMRPVGAARWVALLMAMSRYVVPAATFGEISLVSANG